MIIFEVPVAILKFLLYNKMNNASDYSDFRIVAARIVWPHNLWGQFAFFII